MSLLGPSECRFRISNPGELPPGFREGLVVSTCDRSAMPMQICTGMRGAHTSQGESGGKRRGRGPNQDVHRHCFTCTVRNGRRRENRGTHQARTRTRRSLSSLHLPGPAAVAMAYCTINGGLPPGRNRETVSQTAPEHLHQRQPRRFFHPVPFITNCQDSDRPTLSE